MQEVGHFGAELDRETLQGLGGTLHELVLDQGWVSEARQHKTLTHAMAHHHSDARQSVQTTVMDKQCLRRAYEEFQVFRQD